MLLNFPPLLYFITDSWRRPKLLIRSDLQSSAQRFWFWPPLWASLWTFPLWVRSVFPEISGRRSLIFTLINKSAAVETDGDLFIWSFIYFPSFLSTFGEQNTSLKTKLFISTSVFSAEICFSLTHTHTHPSPPHTRSLQPIIIIITARLFCSLSFLVPTRSCSRDTERWWWNVLLRGPARFVPGVICVVFWSQLHQ